MKKYNVIVVFDKNMEKTLMCKRTKEPYMGMYNLVGGKIEKDNDGLNEAYRELYEETNISDKDISLEHFMNIEYIVFDKMIEVYYGVLNKDVIQHIRTIKEKNIKTYAKAKSYLKDRKRRQKYEIDYES